MLQSNNKQDSGSDIEVIKYIKHRLISSKNKWREGEVQHKTRTYEKETNRNSRTKKYRT